MTVAELIEELQRMPPHHPVRITDGPITRVYGLTGGGQTVGPVVYIDYDYDGDAE